MSLIVYKIWGKDEHQKFKYNGKNCKKKQKFSLGWMEYT